MGNNVENSVSTTGMPAIRQRPHNEASNKENRQPGILAGMQPQGDARQGNNCAPRLLQAARTGDLAQLQPLLTIPQLAIQDCNAALIAAARQGHSDSVLMLLGQAAIQVNARDRNGNTALIWAVRNGHMHVAGILLKQAAIKPLLANYAGMDALAAAAELGHPGMMRVVLGEPGIAAHARSEGCFAALAAAASAGHEAVLQELFLSSGIDINKRDDNGYTLLMMAAEKGQLEVLRWLLCIPAVDISLKERHGATALILAAANGHERIVDTFLAQPGMAINTANALGETALICAVANNHRSVVSSLLAKHQTAFLPHDQGGNNALIVAASRGLPELVALLLDNCSKSYRSELVNSRNVDNDTALIKAVEKGHLATVRLLVETNVANAAARNKKNKSAISIAATKRQFAMLRALLVPCRYEWRAAVDSECMGEMRLAMARADRELLREFLSCPNLPGTTRNAWANSLMCSAAEAGENAVVDILLAPPLIGYYAYKGPRGSALLHAAGAGHAELVCKLLNIGIDVNTADAAGRTTLMHAAFEGQLGVMEVLLQAPGIHVDQVDNDGHSALSHAAQHSHEAGAALLISSRRVNPNRHIKEVPLLQWAATEGITWFVQMLLDAGAYFDPDPNVHAGYIRANPSLEKDVVALLDAYQQQRRNDKISWSAILHDTLYPIAPVFATTDSAASTAAKPNPVPSLQELALQKTCAAIIKGMCAESTVANLLLYAPQMLDWQIPALTKAAALAFIAGHYRHPKRQNQLDTDIANAMTPTMRQVFLEAMARFEKAKRNINRYENNGYTPLTQAAARGDIDMIDLLLALGANIDLPDIVGDHALHEAALAKQWHAYIHLVERQANPASFTAGGDASWQYALTACKDGPEQGKEAAQALLAALAVDANMTGDAGETALIGAIRMEIRWLIERLLALPGIDVNAKDDSKVSGLLVAAIWKDSGALQKLLRVPGIDVNILRNCKRIGHTTDDTPLIMAAYLGHTAIVDMLLRVPGINVNHQNRAYLPAQGGPQHVANNTALMFAAKYGRSDVVKALLVHPGIDPFIRDHEGEDAARLAEAAGHHAIAKRLVAFAAKG